jgi:hypothetical protein
LSTGGTSKLKRHEKRTLLLVNSFYIEKHKQALPSLPSEIVDLSRQRQGLFSKIASFISLIALGQFAQSPIDVAR